MSTDEVHFAVIGLKCGGCENRAKEAVRRLPGCIDASFNHKTGQGLVKGVVDPHAVIQALAAIGYTASVQSN